MAQNAAELSQHHRGVSLEGTKGFLCPTSLPALAQDCIQTLLEYLVTPWAYQNSSNLRDKGCLWVAHAVSLGYLQVSYMTVELIRKKGNF